MAELTNLRIVRDRAAGVRSGDLVLLVWKNTDGVRRLAPAARRPQVSAFWATVSKTGQRRTGRDRAQHRVLTVYVAGDFFELPLNGDEAITRHARAAEILAAVNAGQS